MEHIGNRIKSFIEESNYSSVEVAKQMNTSYQNLYRIFNRESVETRYLIEIAKILGIPVTAFFEDVPGRSISALDWEKLNQENEGLRRQIEKLELEKENLNLLIEFIKKENLLDDRAVSDLGNPPASKYRADGKLSLDYILSEMLELRKIENKDESKNKLEEVIRKMQEMKAKSQ